MKYLDTAWRRRRRRRRSVLSTLGRDPRPCAAMTASRCSERRSANASTSIPFPPTPLFLTRFTHFYPPSGYRSTLNSHRMWHSSHLASSAWSEMTFQPGSQSVLVFGAIGDLCRAITGENRLRFLRTRLLQKEAHYFSWVIC